MQQFRDFSYHDTTQKRFTPMCKIPVVSKVFKVNHKKYTGFEDIEMVSIGPPKPERGQKIKGEEANTLYSSRL